MVRFELNSRNEWRWICVCGAKGEGFATKTEAVMDHLEHEVKVHG